MELSPFYNFRQWFQKRSRLSGGLLAPIPPGRANERRPPSEKFRKTPCRDHIKNLSYKPTMSESSETLPDVTEEIKSQGSSAPIEVVDHTHMPAQKRIWHAIRKIGFCQPSPVTPMNGSRLMVDTRVKSQFTLGPWQCHISSKGFSITDNLGETILSSPNGEGFVLGGGQAKIRVAGNRGFLDYQEIRNQEVSLQTVEEVIQESPSSMILKGQLTLTGGRTCPFEARLAINSNGDLRWVVSAEGLDQLGVNLSRAQGDHLYGMGAQTSPRLDAPFREICAREHGVDRGDHLLASFYTEAINPHSSGGPSTTYSFAPLFFWRNPTNPQAKILGIRTPERAVVEQKPHSFIFRTDGSALEFMIYHGKTHQEALSRMTHHLGKMQPPPPWTQNGLVAGIKRGFADIHRIAEQVERHHVKLSGIWIEDWCGSIYSEWWRIFRDWWLAPQDQEQWLGEVQDLKKKHGIEGLLTYFSPAVSEGGKIFEEAKGRFLVKAQDGSDFLITESQFKCGLLDLTRADVRHWFAKRYLLPHFRKQQNGEAVSVGAMIDFGENYPLEAVPDPRTGLTATQAHQMFPEFWLKTIHEAVELYEKEEGAGSGKNLLFFRRGFTHRPPSDGEASLPDPFQIWMGDQVTGWGRHNGLASLLPYALSLGLSGKPFMHFDIGLYSTLEADGALGQFLRSTGAIQERHEELMMRSAELSAFMAMMRTHEGMKRGLQFWDSPIMIKHMAQCQRLFEALGPARQRLNEAYQETGAPVIRPMWWHDSDPVCEPLTDQAMFGENIVFKPVVKPQVRHLSIYLPQGRWVHPYTGETFSLKQSGPVRVKAPLGQPALFVREGSQESEELKVLRN